MDAIVLLKKQHAEVKSLFKQFDKTDDPERQVSLFNQIADNLAAHCVIEEKLFYPAAFDDETEDMLKEAVEEHLSAKRLIADVLKMKPSDSQYVAKVTVLSEIIDHHVEEEHDDLFPMVKDELEAKELKVLGAQMEEMFDELMANAPRKQVPSQTAAAAPLPEGSEQDASDEESSDEEASDEESSDEESTDKEATGEEGADEDSKGNAGDEEEAESTDADEERA